ncbi:hypothetical protein PGTUg99_022213 [Puccinia graminis f. sp. tritici]|uniref:Conserved oligomeric Golgi complex subunit 1 n=1 Tax=Puccinia graminis f. sp. tritici TaxID=56615 RepID=A0A5B0REG5_PUCGR|nr:hypothetical protein PGTUg99_022213 [Puccinia graminis f. sp. tritici]
MNRSTEPPLPSTSSSSSSTTTRSITPPLRSRHSTRSFTSLAPSDSRSNHHHRPTTTTASSKAQYKPRKSFKLQQLQLQQQQQPNSNQQTHQSIPSKLSIPIGTTRPEDIDLLSIEDPDDLFLNFTIREIRSIERRARSDADQKREDLRQMVGERYRDLLSAADSIVRMKNSSEKLLKNLNHAQLESDRNRLKSKAQLAGNSHTRSITGSSKLSYTLATLVRLLLDLAEHIWRSLEQEDFLTASRYESLGRIISNELTSGNWDESGETEPHEVIEMFPIVERQSETLGQLGPQISSRAKSFLRKWEANSQATMDALAAIILMDNTSLLDSLQLLLQVRKTTFNSLIARLNGSWTELVKNAVRLLLATLENVEQIFLKDDLTNLLKAVQDGSYKEKHLKPLLSLLPNAHQLIHHIPKSIVNFSPFVAALTVSEEFQPHSITQSWFQACQLELISYIDKKLDQVQSTQTLVEFRSTLRDLIGEPNESRFQSTIEDLGKSILLSLNRRFYELYQARLDHLRIEVIDGLKGNDERGRAQKERWILDKKLPVLEPNDPTRFPRYLRSIQNRIEGKLITEEEEEQDGKGEEDQNKAGIVKKMECVGKLLREDFSRWEDDQGSWINPHPTSTQQRNSYLDLGAQFVESCLKEIKSILDQEMEKTNIGKELSVGDLALQILSTRSSFMKDLSLQQNPDQNRSSSESKGFIEDFQAGLHQILSLSSEHWTHDVVHQAVLIFHASHVKLTQNSHYFILESTIEEPKKKEAVTRPSEGLFKALTYLSTTMIKSLGVHRLKAQQESLLEILIDRFVCGILEDNRILDLVSQSSNLQLSLGPQLLVDSIFFDLLFLDHLFFASRPLTSADHHHHQQQPLQMINKVIDTILEQTGEKEEAEEEGVKKKKQETIERVIRFKSTIQRLWWPLFPITIPSNKTITGEGADRNQDGRTDQNNAGHRQALNRIPSSSSTTTTATAITSTPLIDFKKLPKFGGLRCVKPGNRFTLMSIQ